MITLRPVLAIVPLLCALFIHAQPLHHYVAAVQGIESNAQEKELMHYLQVNDPNGRYVIDAGTGDVDIHTTSLLSETTFGRAVNSFGLILLHFQKVQPEALPRRKRNARSA